MVKTRGLETMKVGKSLNKLNVDTIAVREGKTSRKKACKINLDENVFGVYDMRDKDESGNFSRLASGYCKNNTYIKEVALI